MQNWIQWQKHSLLRLLAGIFAIFGITIIVQILSFFFVEAMGLKAAEVFVMLVVSIVFYGGILVLVGILLREHRVSWKDAFGLNTNKKQLLWIIPLATGMCFFCQRILIEWVAYVIIIWTGQEPELQEIVKWIQESQTIEKQLCLGVSLVILAPISEEVLFRGILFPTLVLWLGRGTAIFLNSFLFGLIHANLLVFLPLVVMGIFLSILYDYTRNLLAPIGMHALFNLTNFILAKHFPSFDF